MAYFFEKRKQGLDTLPNQVPLPAVPTTASGTFLSALPIRLLLPTTEYLWIAAEATAITCSRAVKIYFYDEYQKRHPLLRKPPKKAKKAGWFSKIRFFKSRNDKGQKVTGYEAIKVCLVCVGLDTLLMLLGV